MKKLALLLLTLALLLPSIGMPALAETPLVNWNGLELRVLSYSVDRNDDTPMLTLNMRVINNQDIKLWVGFTDSMIDGVPVKDTGRGIEPHTDTGSKDPKYYSFSGSDDDGGAGYAAIKSGRTLRTTLIVQDYDNYDELFRQELSIDLTALNQGPAPVETPKPTVAPSKPDTSSDFGGTAPAYAPSSTSYKTLKKGSKGRAVRDLQRRLIDLGYLTGKVDGAFGRNTMTAIRSFQEQNGLPVSNEATPEMQAYLYSSSAKYYVEPYLPLAIGPSYRLETPRQTHLDNAGMMNILLVNRSSTRGIRGYVLSYYQEDMYGNRITLSAGLTHFESEQMNYIEPGHYKDAFTWVIEKYYNTYAVYVGVQKVVFDDGEVREIDLDEVTYYECAIQK